MSIRKILMTSAALALVVPLMTATPSFAGGGWHGGGGGWHGGGWHGGGWHGGGFFPGAVAGALIGGAIASSAYNYGGPAYYGSQYGYYDQPSYVDEGPVVEASPGDGDAVGYCSQRFRSYDPGSGTYLGYDGLRHPCP